MLNAFHFPSRLLAGNVAVANYFYRNAGTTNIDSDLLAELRQTTTYPPTSGYDDYGADTILYPCVQRDTDTPDLGYHYDPIDYLADGLTVEPGATLTLTNGAVLALTSTNITVGGTLNTGQQMTNVEVEEEQSAPFDVLIGGNASAAYTDADGNGLPDWWEQYYFGTNGLDPNASYDGNGNSLLYDYLNGVTTPNVIAFSIGAANEFVNVTNPSVQLNISSGWPSYYAVLINDSTTTNWLAYSSSNLTVNLGTTDGVYRVNIGLEGYSTNTPPVWSDYRFILDRIAPTVTITNPVIASGAATVIKPYLQLQGFAGEPLLGLSYDISNAMGIATNLDAFVTDQHFDTNAFDFTTNWFQAYDVPLTNGVNRLTLRVADRAGNVTVTNFNVTLDYTHATNPPVVTLIWPQDGMAVSGTNVTMRGTMSDETGTVAAQVVNGDGTTNMINGMVERNHMFWLENVPLNGTNQISVQAVDAAGNVTVTNFIVETNSLTLTIDSTPGGHDLYQPSGSVGGTVSYPSATVTVNGTTATVDAEANDDGTYDWTADDAPIYGQGTATFDAVANTSGGGGGASANASSAVEMGATWRVVKYHSTQHKDVYDPTGGAYWNYTTTYNAQIHAAGRNTYQGTDTADWDAGWFFHGQQKIDWSDSNPGTLTGDWWDEAEYTFTDEPIEDIGLPSFKSVPSANILGGDGLSDNYVFHYYADGVDYQAND
ncbi:MAG TPA: hypothetical protein VHY30_02135 [Verrucomicrobiae bacterium]|jgi:hypothetical protein|nr:hypothetical protein [Verrucomicrobiae bacterium]